MQSGSHQPIPNCIVQSNQKCNVGGENMEQRLFDEEVEFGECLSVDGDCSGFGIVVEYC